MMMQAVYLIDGGQVSSHPSVAVGDVELTCQWEALDVPAKQRGTYVKTAIAGFTYILR